LTNSYSKIKQVLWIILFANLAVACAKIFVGLTINSASVLADGFHSITDGSGNIVGLIGIALASRPDDDDHPYGHAKFETLSSLVIVGMLVYLSIQIISSAYGKFMNPVTPQIEASTFIVMAATFAVNVVVTVLEHKQGVKYHSTILISDAMHTRSDLFVTLGVIASLVLVKMGMPVWIDPLVSLVVAGFILKAAYEIFRMSSKILLDSKATDEKEIREVLQPLTQIKGMHRIRSRGTEQNLFIDLHVWADKDMTLSETHELSHQIEELLKEHYAPAKVQVISHMEPFIEKYERRR